MFCECMHVTVTYACTCVCLYDICVCMYLQSTYALTHTRLYHQTDTDLDNVIQRRSHHDVRLVCLHGFLNYSENVQESDLALTEHLVGLRINAYVSLSVYVCVHVRGCMCCFTEHLVGVSKCINVCVIEYVRMYISHT
jgi:hypothetical protein